MEMKKEKIKSIFELLTECLSEFYRTFYATLGVENKKELEKGYYVAGKQGNEIVYLKLRIKKED